MAGETSAAVASWLTPSGRGSSARARMTLAAAGPLREPRGRRGGRGVLARALQLDVDRGLIQREPEVPGQVGVAGAPFRDDVLGAGAEEARGDEQGRTGRPGPKRAEDLARFGCAIQERQADPRGPAGPGADGEGAPHRLDGPAAWKDDSERGGNLTRQHGYSANDAISRYAECPIGATFVASGPATRTLRALHGNHVDRPAAVRTVVEGPARRCPL